MELMIGLQGFTLVCWVQPVHVLQTKKFLLSACGSKLLTDLKLHFKRSRGNRLSVHNETAKSSIKSRAETSRVLEVKIRKPSVEDCRIQNECIAKKEQIHQEFLQQ